MYGLCANVCVRTPCSNSTKCLPWNWRRQFGVYTFCHSRAMCDFFLLLFGRCCCVFFALLSLIVCTCFAVFFSRLFLFFYFSSLVSNFTFWSLFIFQYFFRTFLFFSVWFFLCCLLLGCDDFIRTCIHLLCLYNSNVQMNLTIEYGLA